VIEGARQIDLPQRISFIDLPASDCPRRQNYGETQQRNLQTHSREDGPPPFTSERGAGHKRDIVPMPVTFGEAKLVKTEEVFGGKER
jgi:hypothetical protein